MEKGWLRGFWSEVSTGEEVVDGLLGLLEDERPHAFVPLPLPRPVVAVVVVPVLALAQRPVRDNCPRLALARNYPRPFLVLRRSGTITGTRPSPTPGQGQLSEASLRAKLPPPFSSTKTFRYYYRYSP